MTNRLEASVSIRKGVAAYFKKKKRVCFFELGLNSRGRLRADIFVLAMTTYMVVVEVKSCVQDFRTDKKLQNYQEFCNKLYIASTSDVYKKIKDEIPDGVGFITVKDGKCRVVRKATHKEIAPETKTNLLVRAAFRNSDTSNRKNKHVSY